jgi:hypothetical protein
MLNLLRNSGDRISKAVFFNRGISGIFFGQNNSSLLELSHVFLAV